MSAKRRASSRAPEKVRLQNLDKKPGLFWTIERDGATVSIRTGKIGYDGRATTTVLPSTDEAKRFFEAAIDTQQRAGFSAPTPATQSKKGVIVRNPDLESDIRATPDDPAPYLVYADWLQQAGNARGDLIAVEYGLSLEESSELERRRSRLLKEFEAELLGPLKKMMMLSSSTKTRWGLRMRWGFVHAARLVDKWFGGAPLADQLRTLLDHPAGAFVRMLLLEREQKSFGSAVAVLAERGATTVKDLSMTAEEGGAAGDVGAVWQLPQLERLNVDGAGIELGSANHERVTELCVAERGNSVPVLDALGRASLPSLRSLALHFAPSAEASAERVAAVLANLERAPRLTSLDLALRRTVPYEEVPGTPREIVSSGMMAHVEAIFRSGLLRKLEQVTLEIPWDKELIQALETHKDALRSVPKLVLPSLETLSLTFGWHVDGVRQRLFEALSRSVNREREESWFFDP